MSEMEQIPKTLPPPPAAEMDSSFESNPKPGVAQMPETAQFPKPPPPQRTLEMRPMPNSTTKPRASTARADWVNTLWADVSGQLRRFAVISNDLFDGLLLRRDTITGSLVLRELRKTWELLGDERNLATVRVLSPEKAMGELWQLLWTIKRHRDPNGRQFFSRTTIDPIEHQTHLELESDTGQTYSVTGFLLPPFIQDYGPGPAEFDPEPQNEFDAMMQDIMTEVDAGTWVDEKPKAEETSG